MTGSEYIPYVSLGVLGVILLCVAAWAYQAYYIKRVFKYPEQWNHFLRWWRGA